MGKRESETIKRTLAVLREANEAGDKAQTAGLALALWVLRGHCPDDWLVGYWEAAGGDVEIDRQQSLNAYCNEIVMRVEQASRQQTANRQH